VVSKVVEVLYAKTSFADSILKRHNNSDYSASLSLAEGRVCLLPSIQNIYVVPTTLASAPVSSYAAHLK